MNVTPRVLIALSVNVKANQDKLKGILQYARSNPHWDIQFLGLHPVYPQLGTFEHWIPDGIIHDPNIVLPETLRTNPNIPIVRIDGAAPGRGYWVTHDSRLISQTVAHVFLSLGFSNFGYVDTSPEAAWSRIRREAFIAQIAKAKFTCSVYANTDPCESHDWGLERHRLAAWLHALPKPCAIMAAMDLRGKQVIDICQEESMTVPKDISVISVDNDEILCESTTPTLTSILPDFEKGGFLAAQLLDELLQGRNPERTTITYGIKRLVYRESVRDDLSRRGFANRALKIIRRRACDGMSVTDLVRALNTSKRYAEIHFKRSTGMTLLDAIRQERLAKVCALLRDTTLPISQISIQSGYNAEAHLKRLFKREFGMSMRDYRKQKRGRLPPPASQGG